MPYTSSWRSPSNIALVKYWGKYSVQLPRNPSLSFTLSACHTDMTVHVITESTKPELIVMYDGITRPAFEPKIKSFLSRIQNQLPWLSSASVIIDSVNTFPYGAGIASSASSVSALALCLADIDDQISANTKEKDASWWRRVSEFARLGSGSACRSVYPVAALWGEMNDVKGSSNSFSIPLEDHISPIYQNFQDTILIVSSTEKSVSSSAGHERMSHLAYAEVRYEVARKNLGSIMKAMQSENGLDLFISVCESEALQLHALMMSGDDPFILMEPNTISIIKEVWRFRKETGVPVCFTLDAGPNVHLLYPAMHKTTILEWLKTNLAPFCKDGKYILDHVGRGPEKLT